jgi:cell cycle checkpoint control protein RAD9A
MNVRDFRAIIQHAGIAGNNLTAQYSTPARPVMLTYPGDAVNCEFLLMTVGERSGNPTQKTKRTKGANGAKAAPRQQLEAASRRQSAAPSEAVSRREPSQQAGAPEEEPPRGSAMAPPPPPTALSARHTIQATAFDLRPSQRPPPPATMRSEGLFVDDDNYQWEPVRDEEEEDDDNTTLEWDHSAQRVCVAVCFSG